MSKMKEVMMHPWGYGVDVRVYFDGVKDCMYHTAYLQGDITHNMLKRLINLAGQDHPEGVPSKQPIKAELYVYRMYGKDKEYQQFCRALTMSEKQCKEVWSYE